MRLALTLMFVAAGIWNPGSGVRHWLLALDMAGANVYAATGSAVPDPGRRFSVALLSDGRSPVTDFRSPVPGSRSPVPDPRSLMPAPGSRNQGARRAVGSIRGRVDIRRVVLAPERRPDVAGLATPAPREQPDTRRAVVYLETAPAGAFEDRDAGRARMDQRNETFMPHVLAVDEGTVVDFPNNDSTYHNVFSLSKAKRFDLGRYARGRSRAVRFDRPGIVRVFCDIHSHMSAFVLVFSHPYYASTEADGRYRIDNVPPGTYAVSAWHEGSTRDTRTVTIPPQGGAVDLDFVVP